MVIQVQPETEAAIQAKVARGEYRDADAVIRAALRVLEDQEIRQSVAEGLAAIERGEGIVLTQEIWKEITREADELARSGRPLRPHVCP